MKLKPCSNSYIKQSARYQQREAIFLITFLCILALNWKIYMIICLSRQTPSICIMDGNMLHLIRFNYFFWTSGDLSKKKLRLDMHVQSFQCTLCVILIFCQFSFFPCDQSNTSLSLSGCKVSQ